jgi:hypothetical protein
MSAQGVVTTQAGVWWCERKNENKQIMKAKKRTASKRRKEAQPPEDEPAPPPAMNAATYATVILKMAHDYDVSTNMDNAIMFCLSNHAHAGAWLEYCEGKRTADETPDPTVLVIPNNEVPEEALKPELRGKVLHMSLCVFNDLEHKSYRQLSGFNMSVVLDGKFFKKWTI